MLRHVQNYLIFLALSSSYLAGITACSSSVGRDATYIPAIELDFGCNLIEQKKLWIGKTQAFARLNREEKLKYVAQLERVLRESEEFERYEPIYRYFADMITSLVGEPVSIPLRPLEAATIIELSGVPAPKLIPRRLIEERPSWDGVPIPLKLKSRSVVVYRGDKRLRFNTADQSLLEEWSPFRVGIKNLFSNGIDPSKKWNGSKMGADLAQHMVSSKGSMFISTSKSYEVAKTFGKSEGSEWSLVIEAVVNGYDLQNLESYFERLDFIFQTSTIAHISSEVEVSVNEPIQPTHIRGLWLSGEKGDTMFIKNPNWNAQAAKLNSHAIIDSK